LTAVTTTKSLFVRLVVSLAVHLKPTTSIRHVTPHPPGIRKQRGMLSQSQYESLRDRHYFPSQRRRRVEDGAEMFVGDDDFLRATTTMTTTKTTTQYGIHNTRHHL